VESFEAGAAELFLPQKDKFYRSGFGAAHLDEEKMKTAFLHDEVNLNAEQSEYFVPVRLGVRPIGSLEFPVRSCRVNRWKRWAHWLPLLSKGRARWSSWANGSGEARRTFEIRFARFDYA